MKWLFRLFLCLSVGFVIGCGGSEVGEPCDEAGSEDDCEDEAICTNESGGGTVCREICESQDDCPAGTTCNGIEGTNVKSCQPD